MSEGDPRSDRELVDAANRGDPAAFEAIYLRYRDWVVSLAYRFTGHRDDSLDVLQDAFAYLLRKFPGFRLTSAMKTFLYPVVKNLSANVRLRRSRSVLDSDALDDAPARPESRTTDAARKELAQALSSLDDIHREVLLMRFVDDMTLEEIAMALGIPVGTVKSRLHSALTSLRDDPRTKDYFSE